MKEIKLSQGKFALVDDEDFEVLNKFSWYLIKSGYVCHHPIGKNPIYLHRQIMHPKFKQEIDHINHNKLDNRRSNLRICNRLQNQRNVKQNRKHKTSFYRGVSWTKERQKWTANININNKRKNLGYYND